MDQQRMEAVVRRLDRVERDNRRWKVMSLFTMMALASVLIMGQARPSTVIEAQEVVIRNLDGQMVARLGVEASGLPSLTMMDREGWGRIHLALGERGDGILGIWGFASRATDAGAPPPARSGAWLLVGPDGGPGRAVVYGAAGQTSWAAP